MKLPEALSSRTARTPRPFTCTLREESLFRPAPYENESLSLAYWLGRMWKSGGRRKFTLRVPGFRPTQLCVGKSSPFSEYDWSVRMVSRPLYWRTSGIEKEKARSSSVPGKRKLMFEKVIAASR